MAAPYTLRPKVPYGSGSTLTLPDREVTIIEAFTVATSDASIAQNGSVTLSTSLTTPGLTIRYVFNDNGEDYEETTDETGGYAVEVTGFGDPFTHTVKAVVVGAGDTTVDSSNTVTVEVTAALLPEFTSSPPLTIASGSAYTYNITTSDATAVITAPTKPSWLTLTDNGDGTATLTGSQTVAEDTEDSVVLTATNATGPRSQSFTITTTATGPAYTLVDDLTSAVLGDLNDEGAETKPTGETWKGDTATITQDTTGTTVPANAYAAHEAGLSSDFTVEYDLIQESGVVSEIHLLLRASASDATTLDTWVRVECEPANAKFRVSKKTSAGNNVFVKNEPFSGWVFDEEVTIKLVVSTTSGLSIYYNNALVNASPVPISDAETNANTMVGIGRDANDTSAGPHFTGIRVYPNA